MAAALAAVEGEELSGREQLAVLRARQRMVSHAQAGLCADIGAVEKAVGDAVGGDPELTSDAASAEVRAALRLTRRAADAEVELAGELCDRLPGVWEALQRSDRSAPGEGDRRRHSASLRGGRPCCGWTVIDRAGGSTTGQLRALVARAGVEAAPKEADHRYTQAVESGGWWRRRPSGEPATVGYGPARPIGWRRSPGG